MAQRVVPAVLLALLAVFHAQLWTGRGSVSDVAEMRRKLQGLKEGLEMVEEKARMELGMVKPNEIYVLVSH